MKTTVPSPDRETCEHFVPSSLPCERCATNRDAYEGCREDLLAWKRRALEAEASNRHLVRALAEEVNGPTFMGEPVLRAALSGTSEGDKPDEASAAELREAFGNLSDATLAGLAGADPEQIERIEQFILTECYPMHRASRGEGEGQPEPAPAGWWVPELEGMSIGEPVTADMEPRETHAQIAAKAKALFEYEAMKSLPKWKDLSPWTRDLWIAYVKAGRVPSDSA